MSIRISGGALRGRRLRSSRGAGLRPTSERVREAMFSILGGAVERARVLDLYAGTGILGIEALSRGACAADFVEMSFRRSQQIRENLRELALADRGHVYRARVEQVLDGLAGGYDLVFADPPYDMDDWTSSLDRLGGGVLLAIGGTVVIEYRHGAAPAERFGMLVQTTARRYGDTGISIFRSGVANG